MVTSQPKSINQESICSDRANNVDLPHPVPKTQVLPSSFFTGLLYLLADILAVILSYVISIALRMQFNAVLSIDMYLNLAPLLLLFPVAYAFAGLYPGIGIAPPEELRRLTYSTSVVFLALAATSFFFKDGDAYSRGVFFIAWGTSLILLPLFRVVTRASFRRRKWWGVGVVVLGAGETGKLVVKSLQKNYGLGFKPLAFLDDDPSKLGEVIEGVAVTGDLSLASVYYTKKGVRHAIVAMPGLSRSELLNLVETKGNAIPNLILVPDLIGIQSLWVYARDLGGLLGLEVRQNLLILWSRILKRGMDLFLVTFMSPILITLTILFAILIKLDSAGPVFYGHPRIGKDGRRFKAWKFRTMVKNADQVLEQYLRENPDLREEWMNDHKLRHDPRITRVGRFLRKTSLDELPQLWNVFKGEMSLVGPRPIVDAEVAKYGSQFAQYLKVLP